jgi:SAM-dependent methyltransferase
MACAEYSDPRFVALYDTVNPFSADTSFYLSLASELSAISIIDIGSGTGSLTCALAGRGHSMTGIEPSLTMLHRARRRPGSESVRWIHGDARQLNQTDADLAIMTGHVAQVITDDDLWHGTLAAIHRSLRPGGAVAFESRNPQGQPWLAWTAHLSRRRVPDAGQGPIDVWCDVVEVRDDLVRFEYHNRLVSGGEELVSVNELRFRTREELTQALMDVGFSVDHVFGDFDRAPVDVGSPELIFVATRP